MGKWQDKMNWLRWEKWKVDLMANKLFEIVVQLKNITFKTILMKKNLIFENLIQWISTIIISICFKPTLCLFSNGSWCNLIMTLFTNACCHMQQCGLHLESKHDLKSFWYKNLHIHHSSVTTYGNLYRRPGGRFKNTYELLNLRALNFLPVNKILTFNVWLRYFVWNFKVTLWNSTQSILPIHWNIWFF